MKTNKYIVTHSSPDQDAVCAIWLIKRFWVDWEDADVLFVPAGETIESYRKLNPSGFSSYNLTGADVVHVDTGMGKYDHHQDNRNTCAAKLVYETVLKNKGNNGPLQTRRFNNEALSRLVDHVNEIDHYREVYYEHADNDRYQFLLSEMLDGLNLVYNGKGSGDIQVTEFGLTALDGVYRVLSNKVGAEEELEKAEYRKVKTKHGIVIGFESGNGYVLDLAQRRGYNIVVQKDPRKGSVRIKALPGKGVDLTPVYEKMREKDSKATWFLHASKALLLNGSSKKPGIKPSTLTLEGVMEIIKEEFS